MCVSYLKELKNKENLGASILDSAVQLSLDYLDEAVMETADISTPYSMHQMYRSLCVLEKQQCMPVAVLAKMWDTNDNTTERIALLFSSMSLAKTSVQTNSAEEKSVGLTLHDLHQDMCREQARALCDEKQWRLRLLRGHMPSLKGSICEVVGCDTSLKDILQHTPQK